MSKRKEDHVCPPSVIKWLNSPLRKLIQNPRKIMGEYVKPGDTVVDIGCGGGFFTVELAEMVGENGTVFAVDLQEEMLQITRKLVTRKGLMNRVNLHKCDKDEIGLTDVEEDFVLAFYMVHETPDPKKFLSDIACLLKPNGLFLVIEPKHHVNNQQFRSMLGDAESARFKTVKEIRLSMSRGVLLSLDRQMY